MKFTQKSISAVVAGTLAVTSFAGTVPSTVSAEEENVLLTASSNERSGKCGENVTWELDDNGTLTLSGTGAITDYNGYESPFFYGEDIVKIVISEGITSIGECVFFDCMHAKSVTIPDSVVKIGECAFLGCSDLTEITIPESVKIIGKAAFYGCSSLTSVTVPKSVDIIDPKAFDECAALQDITIENPKCIIAPEKNTICNDETEEGCSFDGVIKGYELSSAQTYAKEFGYNFESLGKQKFLYGDVDNDGEIQFVDVNKLDGYLTYPDGSSLDNIEAADVYKDGIIDLKDSYLLIEYCMGIVKIDDLGRVYFEADPASVKSPTGVKMNTEKTEFTLDELKDGAEITVYVDLTGSVAVSDSMIGLWFDITSDSQSGIEPMDLILSDNNALGTKEGNLLKYDKPLWGESYTSSKWDDAKQPVRCGYCINNINEHPEFKRFSDSHSAKAAIMTHAGTGEFRTDDSFGEHVAEFKIKLPADIKAGEYCLSFDNAKTMICNDNDITGRAGLSVTDLPTEGITLRIKDTAPEKITDVSVDKDGKVTWTAAENTEYYRVAKYVNGKTYYGPKTTDTSYSLNGIPTTDYIVCVIAYNDKGVKTVSKKVKVKVDDPLGYVNSVSVSEDGKVTWSEAVNAAYYRVGKIVNGKMYVSPKTEGTSYKLAAVPKSDYQLFVTAFDNNGRKTNGAKITVKAK